MPLFMLFLVREASVVSDRLFGSWAYLWIQL